MPKILKSVYINYPIQSLELANNNSVQFKKWKIQNLSSAQETCKLLQNEKVGTFLFRNTVAKPLTTGDEQYAYLGTISRKINDNTIVHYRIQLFSDGYVALEGKTKQPKCRTFDLLFDFYFNGVISEGAYLKKDLKSLAIKFQKTEDIF